MFCRIMKHVEQLSDKINSVTCESCRDFCTRINYTHIEILGGGSQTVSLLWCCVHTLIIAAITVGCTICGDAPSRCTANLQKTPREALAK
jgi:hypothetical protein